MEAFYLAALLQAQGVGAIAANRMVAEAGGAERAWRFPAELGCLSEEQRSGLLALVKRRPGLPQLLAEQAERLGIRAITQASELYPRELKEIYAPPAVLFYRGELQPQARRLAIVGSRRLSRYGKSAAQEIARGLAAAGVTVVSGAARGIDTAAHQGALQEGRTVAVLGCGVDVAYPAENRRLLEEIAATGGAVISEYPPGTRPNAPFFPARNRIISGLSAGTVVVEAAEKSGSLITAELALSEGRDVFAVPGSIYSATSRGCNRLIQQGAKLVMSAEDVLSEYPWGKAEPAPQEGPAGAGRLSPEERVIWQVLPTLGAGEPPLTVDEIIIRLHGSPEAPNVAFLLLQMELKGLIEEDENHAYYRANIKEDNL